jgi:phosphopantothenoylcysteine decarboxylase / phosphopantothenate---cysteine ligase
LLITAGATQEAIDPVRFISNHSSGKMGYALAAAAAAAGANVTLVSGPVHLSCPPQVRRICVTTGREMYAAVMQEIEASAIFIAAAAVADYYCAQSGVQKIKKTQEDIQLTLTPNPDILSAVTQRETAPFTLGFAAETENLRANAQKKLNQKNLDMIAANDVANSQAGFNSDQNAVLVLWQGGEQEFSLRPKTQLAADLLRLVAELSGLAPSPIPGLPL